MSYGAGAALQAAIWQRLVTDAALGAMAGFGGIFDAVPPGEGPETYVLIGPEEVRDASDVSGGGAEHRFVVSVITRASGFKTGKDAAAAVSDALVGAQLVLLRGRLVGLWFQRAVARRERGGAVRRIDMTFRARVEN